MKSVSSPVHALRDVREHRGGHAEQRRRLPPDPLERMDGDQRHRHQRHHAPDRGVEHAFVALGAPRREQRGHEDRRRRRLRAHQRATVEEDRGRHGQHHDRGDLPGPRADLGDQQVAQTHAHDHAEHQLDAAAQPSAHARAQRDGRGDRGEEGALVSHHVVGDQPGDARRQAALQNRQEGIPQPPRPRSQRQRQCRIDAQRAGVQAVTPGREARRRAGPTHSQAPGSGCTRLPPRSSAPRAPGRPRSGGRRVHPLPGACE